MPPFNRGDWKPEWTELQLQHEKVVHHSWERRIHQRDQPRGSTLSCESTLVMDQSGNFISMNRILSSTGLRRFSCCHYLFQNRNQSCHSQSLIVIIHSGIRLIRNIRAMLLWKDFLTLERLNSGKLVVLVNFASTASQTRIW